MNTTSLHISEKNSHFRADSTLLQLLSIGLRAPEGSLEERKPKPFAVRVRRTRRHDRPTSAAAESPELH
jgi:hypothetical protein